MGVSAVSLLNTKPYLGMRQIYTAAQLITRNIITTVLIPYLITYSGMYVSKSIQEYVRRKTSPHLLQQSCALAGNACPHPVNCLIRYEYGAWVCVWGVLHMHVFVSTITLGMDLLVCKHLIICCVELICIRCLSVYCVLRSRKDMILLWYPR